jgi:D-alanine transaminase
MSRVAYVNGRYLPQREAAVNVEDRGYQFGDGVYEVVHVYDGRFIDEDRHLARLERSLKEIRLTQPMSLTSLRRVLREVVARNRVREGLVYIQVTRGVSRRDHPFPTKPVPPAIVVTTRRLPPFPKDVGRWQAAAITTPDLRWARCDIKSVGLLPNVLARQAAREQGAYEAILVNAEGMVTEGAATSVWIVDRNGTLRTRHLDHVILPGCTRGSLIALMQEAGIAFEERGFSAEELRAARETFVTSATSYVRPIVRLDGKPVGDGEVGPVARRLFELFARHVQGGLRNAA